jgi:hypothetical protein
MMGPYSKILSETRKPSPSEKVTSEYRCLQAVAHEIDTGSTMPTGRKRVAYMKMITGLAWLGAFVTLFGKYNFSVALQPWYASMPLWYRYVEGLLSRGSSLPSDCARRTELASSRFTVSWNARNITPFGR